jgi:hypothetical protein
VAAVPEPFVVRRRQGRRKSRRLVAGIAIVVIAGGGASIWAVAGATAGPSYRTVAAELG